MVERSTVLVGSEYAGIVWRVTSVFEV
jgi:hypothetical protein